MRVFVPKKPNKVTLTDAMGQGLTGVTSEWDEASKTHYLSFDNHPEGVRVKFSW